MLSFELGGGGVGDSRPRMSTMEKDLMPSMEERCDGAAAWLGGDCCGCGGGGGLGDASLDSCAIRRRFKGRKYSSPPFILDFRLPVTSMFKGRAFGGGGLGAPTDISDPAGLAGGGLVHNILKVIL